METWKMENVLTYETIKPGKYMLMISYFEYKPKDAKDINSTDIKRYNKIDTPIAETSIKITKETNGKAVYKNTIQKFFLDKDLKGGRLSFFPYDKWTYENMIVSIMNLENWIEDLFSVYITAV